MEEPGVPYTLNNFELTEAEQEIKNRAERQRELVASYRRSIKVYAGRIIKRDDNGPTTKRGEIEHFAEVEPGKFFRISSILADPHLHSGQIEFYK